MLKTDYFKYVIEIAQAGTINKAAERLFISQPYLSMELKNLESKLGVQLFLRSNKGISLTQAGEKFLAYANKICLLAEQAENIKEFYTNESESLRISCMYSFTMLDIYHDFFMQSSEFEHVAYEEIPNELIPDRVYHGNSHIGIFYMYASELERTEQSFAAQGLHFTPLVDEPLCAVLNQDHPLASRKTVQYEELADSHLVLEQPRSEKRGSSVFNIIYPLVKGLKISEPIYFDNNRSLLYYITRDPTCYTVGQKSLNLTNPFRVSDDLVYVPIEGLRDTLITGYIVNENIASTNLQERFIDVLEDYFAYYRAHKEPPPASYGGRHI